MLKPFDKAALTASMIDAPIVVDLGCYDHDGRWPSLPVLADLYKPERIYGFDPHPKLDLRKRRVKGIPVTLRREAAWLYDGFITYDASHVPGRNGTIGVGPPSLSCYTGGRIGVIGEGPDMVPCFDFSAWLTRHGPAVVKMDIEGAEYGLLWKLIEDGTHALIRELQIEWHFKEDKEIDRRLRRAGCKVKTWIY